MLPSADPIQLELMNVNADVSLGCEMSLFVNDVALFVVKVRLASDNVSSVAKVSMFIQFLLSNTNVTAA